MKEPKNPIARLLKSDPRYRLEAYQFVREGLTYAQDVLQLGNDAPPVDSDGEEVEKHLTGQQLCEAIREYAVEQYGYMAQTVLNSWGITSTDDFGNIVYNLIDIQLMKRSKHDRKEDFNGIFSFDEAFRDNFRIEPPSSPA